MYLGGHFTSSSSRDTALVAVRSVRDCGSATRRVGLSLLLFLRVSLSLSFWRLIRPSWWIVLFPRPLLPPLVLYLLLHGGRQAPCTSTSTKLTFLFTRPSPSAIRAAPTMFPAVEMVSRMSDPRRQGQGVFRYHRHLAAILRLVSTVWCSQ